MLLASLSQCHLLWYLDLAARAGVVVIAYVDNPVATMTEHPDGSGEMTAATLSPEVTVSSEDARPIAQRLHADAHDRCFIARSVNFPVGCEPVVHVQTGN